MKAANALVAKEIRLLLPAYIVALLLAIVPVWVRSHQLDVDSQFINLTFCAFYAGVAILALSTFGREFGMKTFSTLLAQPMERKRIWWIKNAVLICAVATMYLAWNLSFQVFCGSAWERFDSVFLPTDVWGFAVAVAILAGGLCATLLLRQIAAALWFTIFLPPVILTFLVAFDAPDWLVYALLWLYSIAAFFWAKRLFYQAQEVGWTGGAIALPAWRVGNAAQSGSRSRRPLAALFWKEVQLHQIGLAGIAGLFLLHLGVVMLRYYGGRSFSETVRAGLSVFGGLWFLVPLLVGGTSIAEERNLGTMQAHLALPVSRRLQFTVKLLMVLLIGGVLSAVLPWTAEGIASSLGADAGIGFLKEPFGGQALFILSSLFLGWSLVCFYSSSLVSGWIQSFAASVLTAVVLWLVAQLAWLNSALYFNFGWRLWYTGFFALLFGVPALVTTFIGLAYGNFKNVSEGWRLWRRNFLVFIAVVFGVVLTASAVYNRVWELLMPLEAAHGPARMVLTPPPTLTKFHFGAAQVHIMMPDGRIWADRIEFNAGRIWFGIRVGNESYALSGPQKWLTLSGNHFFSGSNWMDSAADGWENVAIRDDGTLWISEQPRPWWRRENGRPVWNDEEPSPLVQFGTETNWRKAVADGGGQVVLLKQDGTLWRWNVSAEREKEDVDKHRPFPGLRTFVPHRLGTETNWARIVGKGGHVYAWKDNGQFWSIYHTSKTNEVGTEVQLEPGMVMDRERTLDNFKFKSFATGWFFEAGLAEDGSLWAWNERTQRPTSPIRLGNDADWTSLATDGTRFVARKADGSLWAWRFDNLTWAKLGRMADASDLANPAETTPTRLGTQSDWLAIVGDDFDSPSGLMALAADGSLWQWWLPDHPNYYFDGSLADLRPPRRPSFIANIFDN